MTNKEWKTLSRECKHPFASKCINCNKNGDCKALKQRNNEYDYNCQFFKTKEEFEKQEEEILSVDNGFYRWFREFQKKCRKYDRSKRKGKK